MVNEHTPYMLAKLAGCASPDSETSPGAAFLERVASTVDDYSHDSDRDWIHEAADGAVPVYTYDRWLTFVDLAAYQEDISELGMRACDDLTDAAGVALYMIADRLLQALVDEDDDERADEDDE